MKTIGILQLVFALCLSCSVFSPGIEVTIVFPPIPAAWAGKFQSFDYTIEYPNENGGIEKVFYSTDSREIRIRIAKMGYVPILCTPIANGIELYPCGSVFPFGEINTTNGTTTCHLSWELGFVSEILSTLIERGYDINALNVPRLITEIETKAEGDPWKLDKTKLMEGLVSGEFSVYDIDSLQCGYIEISPVSGIWLSVNPFQSPVTAREDGTIAIENLTYGFHRFVGAQDTEILDIFIDEKEAFWIVK
jgi:hypothetical protein